MLRLVKQLLSRWELDVEPPTTFTGTSSEIAQELATDSIDRAAEILTEARDLYQSVEARAEGAERRATTLQGAVSVAATLAVAGATLLADPTKIHGTGWRIALAFLFLGVVYCLVATAYRAAQASSQVHTWHFPNPQDVFGRIKRQDAEAKVALAADLFHCYARNTKIADWKVAYMRAASEWFARGLILLLALAVAIALYVAIGPNSSSEPGESSSAQRRAEVVEQAVANVPSGQLSLFLRAKSGKSANRLAPDQPRALGEERALVACAV